MGKKRKSSSGFQIFAAILFLATVLLFVAYYYYSKSVIYASESSGVDVEKIKITSLRNEDSQTTSKFVANEEVLNVSYTGASKVLNNNNNEIDNPTQSSEFAYVTLVSGIDSTFKYRGFLYDALIMKKALVEFGSKADFIVLIGYSESNITPFESDMDLLKQSGIIIHILPRLLDESHKLGFAEMALLKITPYSFTQYKKVQFFDGDVMPTKNMDCFFELNYNAFTVGLVSPLNSGWFLAIPNQTAYSYMKDKAIWRLGRDWDIDNGWGEPMPSEMFYRGGKVCDKWLFNGADMDQGLFTHYFIINHGNAILIDTDLNTARLFSSQGGIKYHTPEKISLQSGLSSCGGEVPIKFFAHFTGRSKPWMLDLNTINPKRSSDLLKWKNLLDSLHLSINSSNIGDLKLGSRLGFFNANFPKGGYKKKEI